MIYRSENYKELYQKRFAKDVAAIEDFSAQEFSDLMALFNLVWIDPVHFERYPRLQELWENKMDIHSRTELKLLIYRNKLYEKLYQRIKSIFRQEELNSLQALITTQSCRF